MCLEWFAIAKIHDKIQELEKAGVEFRHLFVRDFHLDAGPETPIDIETANEFLEKIEEARNKGENVVIHCRGGKGRSYSLLAIHLVLSDPEGKLDLKTAFENIKKLRPQVSFNDKRLKETQELLDGIRAFREKKRQALENKQEEKFSDRSEYLSSDQFKRALVQMPAYRALLVYAFKCAVGDNLQNKIRTTFKTNQRYQYIQDFFCKILFNPSWYGELALASTTTNPQRTSRIGELSLLHFITSKKVGNDDRKNLLIALKNGIDQQVSQELAVSGEMKSGCQPNP